MKLLHTSDLHIGKAVNDFSMIKDQEYVLNQIIQIAKEEKVDAVLIAGDVYDRSIPPAEAVELLDSFLTKCMEDNRKVFLVSGNHDSPERMGFANHILERQGIFIAGTFDGKLQRILLEDEYGILYIDMLPFLKASLAGGKNSKEAVTNMIATIEAIGKKGRAILMTHYFVVNEGECPELSDSETMLNVGGLDDVPVSIFKDYDYVALGHIHKPQKIGEKEVYYSGTPLKYSFSEVNQKKGVNLIEIKEKGNVTVRRRALIPLHDMRIIKGNMEDLLCPDVVNGADAYDYIQAILTDKEELFDPMGTMRSRYPNMMQIVREKQLEEADSRSITKSTNHSKSTLVLFREFYKMIREEPMDKARETIVIRTIKEAEEK